MADIAEMREIVSRKYYSDTPKGRIWPKKVRAMQDSQVIAIYLRLEAEEKKNNRRREWEEYPLYVG